MNSYDGKKDSAMRLLYLMKYPSKAFQVDPFDDDDDDIDDGKDEPKKEEKGGIGGLLGRRLVPDGFKPLEQHRR